MYLYKLTRFRYIFENIMNSVVKRIACQRFPHTSCVMSNDVKENFFYRLSLPPGCGGAEDHCFQKFRNQTHFLLLCGFNSEFNLNFKSFKIHDYAHLKIKGQGKVVAKRISAKFSFYFRNRL